jgi:uncharacterized protein (TIRG00374 family)
VSAHDSQAPGSIWLRTAPLVLGVVLTAGLAVWLARSVDLDALTGVLRQARLGPLLLLALLPVLSNAVRALRLHAVLEGRTGLWRTIHVYNIGIMINCLLPLRSGDMCMALLLGPGLPGGRSEALSRLFVDRLFDVLAVLALFAATLPLLSQAQAKPLTASHGLWLISSGLFLIVGAAWAVCACEPLALRTARGLAGMLRRDAIQWERRISAALTGMRCMFQGRVLFVAGSLSLLTWALVALTLQAGMAALFPPPGLACAMLAMSLTVFGLIVAPTPAGIGTIHGAIILGLGIFGIGTEQALAVALLYHAATTAVSLLMGAAGLWTLGFSLGPLLRGARAALPKDSSPI